MALKRKLLMRLFGRPQGFLGRLGGPIMARMNREAGEPLTCLYPSAAASIHRAAIAWLCNGGRVGDQALNS